MHSLEKFISVLRSLPEIHHTIRESRVLPGQPARYQAIPDDLSHAIRLAWEQAGIKNLYAHQVEALNALRAKKHTALVTPTASGKTLVYNTAVAQELLNDPQARALYLFPLKALAQDQAKNLLSFVQNVDPSGGLSVGIYDGDTPASRRAVLRKQPPRILITNPDMLHYGLMAYPEAWKSFFQRLRLVVLDEAHTYRGVFGSHVAFLLRRLWRLCEPSQPTIAASSATIANPVEFLEQLTGRAFHVIDQSGAPRPERHVFLMQPEGSANTLAAKFVAECLDHQIKTLVFTKSRKSAELLQIWARDSRPEHSGRLAAYRAGYLASERRKIEGKLFGDRLTVVISTSALEAGIDIGGLDAVVLVGYPGTMMSAWQRIGRAGRGEKPALILLIAQEDVLDHYYLHHPEKFFAATFEHCVVDPSNHALALQHLPCAAMERPLQASDRQLFGDKVYGYLAELEAGGRLRKIHEREAWLSALQRPHRFLDFRGAGKPFVIVLESSGVILGSVDDARVFREGHPGAIYYHAGEQYEITALEMAGRTVSARLSQAQWYTQVTSSEAVEIISLPPQTLLSCPGLAAKAACVEVSVTEKIVAFERRRVGEGSLISEHSLHLPPRRFETQAVLLILPRAWGLEISTGQGDFAGALHAVEHAMIATLPIHVLCDRGDLGGLSALVHPQIDGPCIFIYDGYPGGIGLAQKGLQLLKDWVKTTRQLVGECECEIGCPACIQSPKCGSGNKPLDKAAACFILQAMTKKGLHSMEFYESSSKISGNDFSFSRGGDQALEKNPKQAGSSAPLNQAQKALDFADQDRVTAPAGHLVFFDLETQRSAAEVGGWQHAARMGMSVGVVYDGETQQFHEYREADAGALIQHLLSADRVIGFNIDRFDLAVLSAYSPFIHKIRTFDMLKEIYDRLGFRLSLDHLARYTLGQKKSADGLQALTWFAQGRWEDLIQYCRQDVAITRDLFFWGWEKGYLVYEKSGTLLQCPTPWRSFF